MQYTVLGVIGMVSVVSATSGLHLNFVKPGLRWPLVAAGLLLVALAGYGLLSRREAADEGHGHSPRVGWLLAVPFLLLGVVTPPPLGAYSAERDSGLLPTVQSAEGLPPLPASSGPLELSLSEFSARALYDEQRPLEGRLVRLTGFVSSTPGGQGWALTRIALACCAADGTAVKVDLRGAERLPDDTWVEVEGVWLPTAPVGPGQATSLPVLQVSALRRIERPAQPYE